MSARILLEGLAGDPSALLLEGECIAAVGAAAIAAAGTAARVDAAGLRAVPGFVELQVNGIDGHDFTSDPAAIRSAGVGLARHGVTAFLATIVSSPRGTVEAALAALADASRSPSGAVPLGLHVEGPFISPARRGAHEARHLRPPDLGELRSWVAGGARLVTLAPELPGGLAAIEEIAGNGGVASIGHTDADAETTAHAIEAGARCATHLFNAMPPLHQREPGVAGVLLDDERVTIGLIADGVHVDPRLLRIVARAAPGRIALVSDAVGRRLGSATVAHAGGSARLADGTLAGGFRQLDHGLRTFAAATGSVAAAVEAATAVPARLLGLADGRGALRPGGRADVVLLDAELAVAATVVGGRPVHLADGMTWP